MEHDFSINNTKMGDNPLNQPWNLTKDSLSPPRSCYLLMSNPEPQEYIKFRFTIDVCIVGILCIFGFIGNALCIAVLRRDMHTTKEKNKTTSWILQALAVADTGYLIACCFFQVNL